MTKREIMIRAHEIARTLEGDYIARMALALRMAWEEACRPKFVKFVVGISKGTAYVARITGRHPKYKFAREFVPAAEKNRSWSGKNGTNTYYITENGIYEKAYGSDREYFLIQNGVARQIDLGTVLALVG
jgi:hypothetical protein